MQDFPQRKDIRLKGYNYSEAGYYFITLCTKDKRNLFGKITDGMIYLNDCGKFAESELQNIPSHYDRVQIDKYIVMPNHVHMIVVINPARKINQAERINPFPTTDIPHVIGRYKAGVTRIVGNAFMRSDPLARTEIWQKRYHDHIIRNEAEYLKIWKYIDENPMKWEVDKYFGE